MGEVPLYTLTETRAKIVRFSSIFGRAGDACSETPEREFFIVNLLVPIHCIIEIILVDRPCALGV